ncbi:DUF6708 domain-containing protein, partial [Gilliamella sp. Pas-s27]|uniref:DUF6708 domain-containing protein n=1 Tax=Gilliamella sp. Pas-s27 TaxID=2687311 RepID=UPI00139F63B4
MPSKYQPQVSAWCQDLYKWVYTTNLHLSNNKKLRYANDDFCEFSRRSIGLGYFSRWITIICLSILILLSVFVLYIVIPHIPVSTHKALVIPSCVLVLFIFYLLTQFFFYLSYAPEDCPIRFNRKTGKVYVYEHFILYFGTWTIFTRSPFRAKEITVKEFNWADIQGCMASVSVPLASGGT